MEFVALVVMLALVVACVAIRRANASLRENARLKADLHDLARHVARFMEQSRQNGDVAPSAEAATPASDAAPRDTLAARATMTTAEPEALATSAEPTPSLEPAQAVPETTSAEPEPIREAAREEAPAQSGPAPRAARANAERAFATKWTVWIGGIALAMGGLLIVRYSIEAGFFGPGVRLMMGAVFAFCVAAASEFIRRRDLRNNMREAYSDQIPAVLAGVSVLSAFGVAYAAHAVYGMIGAGAAFIIMGAIGLAALAASLLHGSKFGLFGLLGSYVTPFLVGGSTPDFMALSIFIAVVTSAAFALHIRRPSNLLTGGAIVGHTLWAGLIELDPGASSWGSFLLIVAIVLALLISESAQREQRASEAASDGASTWTAHCAFAAPLVLAGVLWVELGGGLWPQLTLVAIVAGNIMASIRYPGLAALAPLAGAGATGMTLLWPAADGPLRVSPRLVYELIHLDLAPTSAAGLTLFATFIGALISAPTLAALMAPWRAGAGRPFERGCLAFASALAPVCIMLAASLRLNGFNRAMGFALIAACLAIGFAVACELLFRKEQTRTPNPADPMAYVGSAGFAAGSAIAIGLGIAFALRETWLVVGFAIASSGVALVARWRPIPLLRGMSASLGTAALARIFWQPVLTDVGDLPALNWLCVVYGLPALAFGVAVRALAARRDRALTIAESLAAFFTAAFVLLEVVQGFAGANLWDAGPLFEHMLRPRFSPGLAGQATGLAAMLSVAAALLAVLYLGLKLRFGGRVFAAAETVAACVLLLAAAGGLCVLLNPMFNGAPVREPVILNRLLFGYAGVGVLLALLANALPRRAGNDFLQGVLEALATTLGVLGAVLVLRHWFAGPGVALRDSAFIGYFESVSTTLLLQAMGAVVALWSASRGSALLRCGFVAVGCLAAGYGALFAGFANNPMLSGVPVEGPILFNSILWGYAPVAAGFALVGLLARRLACPMPRLWLGAGALAAGLTAFLLARQGFHGPALVSSVPITLAEAGTYASLALVSAFAASRARVNQRASPGNHAFLTTCALVVVGFSVLTFGLAAIGGAALAGWTLLNNSLPGLLLPTLLAAALALWSRNAAIAASVPRIYGAAAVVGGLVYVLAQIRFAFPKEDWLDFWTSGSHKARLFGYSLAMIVYGVLLLVAGFRMAWRDLRLAALAVVALAVVKVFLLDLAGLEGLWRAMSFIGLGVGLIGIAYLYRWLEPPGEGDADA